jgi:hypothetical protein
MKSGQPSGQSSERQERLRRAIHLRDAIEQVARERRHSAAQVARVLDMSVGHWYRIKADPLRFGRLTLQRVTAIAKYVGWPRVQVVVAIGWLDPSEVDEVLSAGGALQKALQRLAHGGIANHLPTPLTRAAPDHQALMARLFILAESAVADQAIRG